MIIENAANSNRHNKERWFSDLRHTCVSPSLSLPLSRCHKVAIKPDAKPEDEHVSVSVCMCVHMSPGRQRVLSTSGTTLWSFDSDSVWYAQWSLCCAWRCLLLLLHSKWAKPKRAKKRASERASRVPWLMAKEFIEPQVVAIWTVMWAGKGGEEGQELTYLALPPAPATATATDVCMHRTRSQVSKVAKWSVLLPFAAFT